jgi:hypothetical protein
MTDSMKISGMAGSRTPLIVALVAGWLSVVLYLCPGEGVLPAEIVSVTSYFLAQALLPRCRMTVTPLVTPLNWLQLAFFLQLVVMPVIVRTWGFAQKLFLPYPPTILADNLALLLVTLAYWSFCTAVHFRNVKPRAGRESSGAYRWSLPTPLICTYAVLGIIGLIAHYKTSATFIHALTDPASYMEDVDRHGASASLFDVMGDFLSSFLGTALVMVWCKRLDRGVSANKASKLLGPVLLILTALAFAVTGYNRANIVFPLVALLAVVSIRTPRQALRNIVVVGSLIIVLVTTTVIYRFSSHPEDIGTGPSVDVLNRIDYMEFFQLYGQAPQYLAIVLQDSHYGLEPFFGRLSGASVLSQIPALGKTLRPINGRSYYATLTGHPDENPSFVGEVFLDFNVMGVIAAFWLVGYAIATLQQRVLHATQAFEVYVFQTIGIYLLASVLLSVDVLGQFYVFNMFPFYVYFALRPFLRKVGAGKGLERLDGYV